LSLPESDVPNVGVFCIKGGMNASPTFLWIYGNPSDKKKPEPKGSGSDCRKTPCGLFRQTLAACCVHNLSPSGGQIPHLQSEMCFLPGTRPGRKRIGLYLAPMAANSARLF